jgi:AcrR family transcriptional regulator
MTEQHSGSGDIHRSLALMWEYDEKAARGPKPRLTLEQVVDRAVAIADAEGLDALSMRRVAKELGVGTMSLYRYVPGKEELLDLMLDRVNGPGDRDAFEGLSWREAMQRIATGLWELYTTHRWLPMVDQSRPVLGPRALASFDVAVGALAGMPLSSQEKVAVISMVDAFAQSAARTVNNAVLAEERTGVTAEEFWQAQEPLLVRAMESGSFPHVARLAEDAFAMDGEAFYRFGVERLLDGLAVLVEARPPAGQ